MVTFRASFPVQTPLWELCLFLRFWGNCRIQEQSLSLNKWTAKWEKTKVFFFFFYIIQHNQQWKKNLTSYTFTMAQHKKIKNNNNKKRSLASLWGSQSGCSQISTPLSRMTPETFTAMTLTKKGKKHMQNLNHATKKTKNQKTSCTWKI